MFLKTNLNPGRRLLLSLFCCMLLSGIQNVFSQTYINKVWQQTYGGNGVVDTARWGNTCVFDSLGNMYIAGSKKMTGGSTSGIILVKIDQYGDTAWSKTYQRDAGNNDFAVKIATDKANAVYIICASNSTITKWDWEILKYNLSGVRQWVVTYNGMANKEDVPTAITIDGGGNPIVTGYTTGFISHEDWYTVKYNSSGVPQWSSTYDNNNLQDIPTAIAVATNNDVFVTGGSSDASNNREITTIKYDHSTGSQNAINRQSTTNNIFDMGLGIKLNPSNTNVYVTGNMSDTGGNYKIVTIKYNSSLTQQWIKKYRGDGLYNEARGIDLDASENVFVTGFKNNYDSANTGGRSLVIIKYSSSGTLLWSDNFWSTNKDTIEPIALYHDAEGNIYIAATIRSLPSYSNACVIMYDGDGNLLFNKQVSLDTGENATATDIIVLRKGNIFLTGTKGAHGNLNYFTTNYQVLFQRDSGYLVNDTPRYVKNELLVRFLPSALNSGIIDNLEINFGSATDFLPSEIKSDMETALGFSLNSSSFTKIFNGYTSADSVSLSRLGDTVHVPDFWHLLSITFPNGTNLDSAAKHLSGLSFIAYAEKDAYPIPLRAPNDPAWSATQISMHYISAQSNLNAQINADTAWNYETGKNFVKVAVFDGGIDYRRKDFQKNASKTFKYLADTKIAGGRDYFNDGIDSLTTIKNFPTQHATFVSGILGAIRNNGVLMAGVAGGNDSLPTTNINRSGCPLYTFRIFRDSVINGLVGTGAVPEKKLIEGILDASYQPVYPNPKTKRGFGMHVINASFGTVSSASLFGYTMFQAVGFAYRNKVIFVAARGNGGSADYVEPSCYKYDDWIISVGESSTIGTLKTRVNALDGDSIGSSYGRKMDLLAPGDATIVKSLDYKADNITSASGSSVAAPHVSGTVALMLSHYNHSTPNQDNLAPEDVQNIIKMTCRDITGIPASVGYDQFTGYGLLNAGKAVMSVDTPWYKVKHIQGAPTWDTICTHDTVHNYLINNFVANTYFLTADGYWVVPYKVRLKFFYSTDAGYDFVTGWARGSSSDLLNLADSNKAISFKNGGDSLIIDPDNSYAQLYSIDKINHYITVQGFVFRVLGKDSGSTNLISRNIWIPFAPGTKGGYGSAISVFEKLHHTMSVRKDEPNQVYSNLYPNPSSNVVTIQYSLPVSGNISLDLINIRGQLVESLADKYESLGVHTSNYSIGTLAPGVYMFRLKFNGQSVYEKFVKTE
jgi:hypothetical protein